MVNIRMQQDGLVSNMLQYFINWIAYKVPVEHS